MRSRLFPSLLTGGIIGATAGIYAVLKTSPRQRRRYMKQGTRFLRNVSRSINLGMLANMFR